MTSNLLSRLLQIVAILALAAVATPSLAKDCVFSGSGLSPIDFGTINVPQGAAVGTQLGPAMQTTINWSCPANPGAKPNPTNTTNNTTNDAYWFLGGAPGAREPNGNRYKDTGIRGIGLSIAYTGSGKTEAVENYRSNWGIGFGGAPFSASPVTGAITVTYKLYVTGPVSGGGRISMPPTMVLRSFDWVSNGPMSSDSPTSSVGATIVSPTCSTSNVTVTLPTVSADALATVGQAAGITPFAIQLACPAGNPAKLFMTLTDATKPENRTSNLSLASTSTAKGVAVRIVEDGKSLSYGPDNAVVRNPNQFALATLGDGGQIFAVPMTAAYVSTGLVMPGSVQAVAIFTMSYQ